MRSAPAGFPKTFNLINQELTEVLMWLRREKPLFDRNQWRAGWHAIQRSYLRCLKQTPGELSWSPVLEPFVIDSWRIRPLTTSNDLALEGIRMRHCVAEYDESCHEGTCHIFTVEDVNNDEPAAMISLAKSNSGWVVDQVKGRRNIDPCPEMQDIAKNILEKLAARIDPVPKE